MLKTLDKTITIWMNNSAKNDTKKDRNVGKHLVVTNEEKLPKLELRESRSTTSFVPLETDSLTEELMQDEVRRGASDFGTKYLLVLIDKGLVVAT